MRKLFLVLLLVSSSLAFGQTAKLLPRNINHPTSNVVYPAVSGDGKVMVFMSDYSDTGDFVMMISKYRAGKWQDPVDVEIIGSSKVNNWGGYSLNYDGSEILFSSRRSDGIGKFDIWHSTLKDGEWSRPKNMGKPINSPGNEGNPSISSDGQRIYFMKCESMAISSATGCKIYYSEKGPRGWQAAVELPGHINRGNTSSPRILPDNRTLVFASNRSGGKGDVDIWLSKRTGDHWSEPINIDVVNTAGKDYFLTATMRSIAYITTENSKGNKAIAELRLPEKYRLDNVIIRQGTVRDEEGNSLAAEVRAYNLDENTYEARLHTSASNGEFIMILPGGTQYDIAYNEVRLTKLYQSEYVDTRELRAPRREYPNIVLKNLEQGATFSLGVLNFVPYTSTVDESSSLEISRLVRVLKRFPELDIEIGAYQREYIEEDSPRSDDLTESRFDTLIVYKQAIRVDTMGSVEKDLLLQDINEKLETVMLDTIMANTYLERMATIDSVAVEELHNVYHNNRTTAEAEAIKTKLVEKGISETRLLPIGYKDKDAPLEFPVDKDRMIVIKLLTSPKF